MKKKILIVDDKPELRQLLSSYLKNNFDVIVTSDGVDAFQHLQDGNIPDLIISDIQMPRMDGFELISQLKTSGFFSKIPVIILSSLEESSERVRFLKAGANDFIVKPFNPEELELRIEKQIM